MALLSKTKTVFMFVQKQMPEQYLKLLASYNFRPRTLLLENDAKPLSDKRLHENWTLHSSFRCRVSGVSSKKARASLKPDTRHLTPMLRKGFTTPDNVQKKDLFS